MFLFVQAKCFCCCRIKQVVVLCSTVWYCLVLYHFTLGEERFWISVSELCPRVSRPQIFCLSELHKLDKHRCVSSVPAQIRRIKDVQQDSVWDIKQMETRWRENHHICETNVKGFKFRTRQKMRKGAGRMCWIKLSGVSIKIYAFSLFPVLHELREDNLFLRE